MIEDLEINENASQSKQPDTKAISESRSIGSNPEISADPSQEAYQYGTYYSSAQPSMDPSMGQHAALHHPNTTEPPGSQGFQGPQPHAQSQSQFPTAMPYDPPLDMTSYQPNESKASLQMGIQPGGGIWDGGPQSAPLPSHYDPKKLYHQQDYTVMRPGYQPPPHPGRAYQMPPQFMNNPMQVPSPSMRPDKVRTDSWPGTIGTGPSQHQLMGHPLPQTLYQQPLPPGVDVPHFHSMAYHMGSPPPSQDILTSMPHAPPHLHGDTAVSGIAAPVPHLLDGSKGFQRKPKMYPGSTRYTDQKKFTVFRPKQSRKLTSMGNVKEFIDSDGVPYLAFKYPLNNKRHEIRVDIENVDVSNLSMDFKKQHCVYTNALHPETYTGARLNYETMCNEIGWKLVLKNPALAESKGLRQRAIDCYKNKHQDLKSRRVKKMEKQSSKQKGIINSDRL